MHHSEMVQLKWLCHAILCLFHWTPIPPPQHNPNPNLHHKTPNTVLKPPPTRTPTRNLNPARFLKNIQNSPNLNPKPEPHSQPGPLPYHRLRPYNRHLTCSLRLYWLCRPVWLPYLLLGQCCRRIACCKYACQACRIAGVVATSKCDYASLFNLICRIPSLCLVCFLQAGWLYRTNRIDRADRTDQTDRTDWTDWTDLLHVALNHFVNRFLPLEEGSY